MTIRAVIDVGSHSVLLLVAEETEEAPRVLLEEYRITGLGSGLGQTGRIDPEAAERTGQVIAGYRDRCRELGAGQVVLVGTSALREAGNRQAVLTGHEIRVLSPKEEAGLTRRGALSGLDLGDDAVVFDLGGRSTEMTWPGFSHSIPVGCQRGAQDVLATDPPTDVEISRLRDRVRSHLPAPPGPGPLVFSGGTATTLAAMDLALDAYRPDRVHGHSMSRARLGEILSKLVSVPLAERQDLLGIEPGRAGVLPAGGVILDELCRWCQRDSFMVSARGLTWGVWLASG
jgi:exopolyphosphatase/guanosine-5'-triphosphate,3'-diphosphate pyrophosphatase